MANEPKPMTAKQREMIGAALEGYENSLKLQIARTKLASLKAVMEQAVKEVQDLRKDMAL